MAETLVYENPPPAVQDAVAAVIRACRTWQPVAKDLPPLGPPPIASTQVAAAGLTEAQVCGYLRDPDAALWTALNLSVTLVFIVLAFVWFTRLHRLPGALLRLAARGWSFATRRQGGNPWH